MATIAKDAPKQLYGSVFAILTGDTGLSTLLNPDPSHPKIYQVFIDFDAASLFKDDMWITYAATHDSPMHVEQMQDVHEITLSVNIWRRGPGADVAEDVEARCRELLDNANLATPQLLSWYCHWSTYSKLFDPVTNLWRIATTYNTMVMAINPE